MMRILCLLLWIFFPVDIFLPLDIMSHSVFIRFNVISNRRFLLLDVLSRSFLCPFVVIYHLTFCPFNVFYLSTFFPSTFCPIHVLSVEVFLPSGFFISTFCWWIGQSHDIFVHLLPSISGPRPLIYNPKYLVTVLEFAEILYYNQHGVRMVAIFSWTRTS